MLVHGVIDDPGRVMAGATIFAELGVKAAPSHDEIEDSLASRRLAFAPIASLAPAKLAPPSVAAAGSWACCNSTHTLVKILQPFAHPGLRLVNYTHPEYRESLTGLFTHHPVPAQGGALLARAALEGEAVADTRRQVPGRLVPISGHSETLVSGRSAPRPTRRPSICPNRSMRPPPRAGSKACCAARLPCRPPSPDRSK